ncbi:MAG: DNA translocase FtsK [Acidimicrobiales bacterium]
MATKTRSRGTKKRARTRRASAPPVTTRLSRTAAIALDGHRHDAWGLALVAAGVLVALGVYANLTGAFGAAVDLAAGFALGLVKVALPVGLVAAGVVVLRGGHDADLELHFRGPRLAVAGSLLVLATCGLLHLGGGRPGLTDTEDLGHAGGVIGVAVGGPLDRLFAAGGASLVLATVGLVGLVILTHTSVADAAGRTAPLGRLLTAWSRRLFDLPERSDEPASPVAAPAAELYDQDAEARAETKPKPKRPPKPKIQMPTFGPTDVDPEQLAIDLGPSATPSLWKLPALGLLKQTSSLEIDRRAIEARGHQLESAMAEHQVETRLVGMVVGPTVTRYELELAPGVKVNRVTSLHKDIAYAMATPDVRILAPIPGKQAIGVEVPNEQRQMVALGDILASTEARRAVHPLEVAVGRDISGKAVLMNLATMPHLLIAGQTGAGKSSCLNSLITSVLMRSTPDQVRMILVDPKRVEMGQYSRLPHLLTDVVTSPKKAANALAWAVKEMERRYDLLHEVGFRDVTGYNAAFDRGELKSEPASVANGLDSHPEYPRLPFVLVVVDELADLMMIAARDVEESICRLAQMARAVGIHLVIATQRPSVNIITGLIKANIPARLAFSVSSATDSRVILDQMGAEKLVGMGDMLLLEGGTSIPRRVQGCWVGEDEVRKVVGQWRRQSPDVAYDDDVQGRDDTPGGARSTGSPGGDDDDDLLWQAMELVVRSQLGSTSMLQRKLKVGFARAGRLMDLLEQRGVVGPSEGSKARAVLMTAPELDELLDQR